MDTERHRCPDAELIARYCEGALTGGERDEVEAHLAVCPRCLVAVRAASAMPRVSVVRRPGKVVIWALASAAAIMVAASIAYRALPDGSADVRIVTEERARMLEQAFLSAGGAGAGGVTVVPAESSATGSDELVVDPFPGANGLDEPPGNESGGVDSGGKSVG